METQQQKSVQLTSLVRFVLLSNAWAHTHVADSTHEQSACESIPKALTFLLVFQYIVKIHDHTVLNVKN